MWVQRTLSEVVDFRSIASKIFKSVGDAVVDDVVVADFVESPPPKLLDAKY